jgi:glycosyltransferase 2 family protein
MKNFLKIMIRVCVSGVIILLLLRKVDIAKVIQFVGDIHPKYALIALIIVIILRVWMAIRWEIILTYHKMAVTLQEIVSITFISLSIGQLFPGGIGPDVMRAYQLHHRYGRLVDITTTILLDRIIGMYSIFFVGLLGAIMASCMGFSTGLIPILIVINGAFIIGWYVSKFFKKLSILQHPKMHKINRLKIAITSRETMRSIFPKVFLFSVLAQVSRCFVFYFLYVAMGVNVNLIYFFSFIPLVYVITFIPIGFNGIGLREGALIYFFSTCHIPSEVSIGVGLVFQLVNIAAAVPGIVLWFTEKSTRETRLQETAGD